MEAEGVVVLRQFSHLGADAFEVFQQVGKRAIVRALKDYGEEADLSVAEQEQIEKWIKAFADDSTWSTIADVVTVMKPLLDVHAELTVVSQCE